MGKGGSDYLQVELQALPPLFQDFGDPVSDMFGRHLRRLYALLKLENYKYMRTVVSHSVKSVISEHSPRGLTTSV